jgi:FkbM family methyltransferase
MNIRRFLGKCLSASYIVRAKAQPSYSQAGEDQVVRYLFNLLHILQPSYLDIGVNHPVVGNNTYYFYLRGSKGVCVEPDPGFYSLIKKYRGRDRVLQVGIGSDETSEALLYIFPHPYSGWNTFSKEEALSRQNESGIGFAKSQRVPLLAINSVIEKYFDPHPNFISIDVEGMDLAILQSLDFSRFKPEVICVETVTFSTHQQEEKLHEVIDFLNGKDYFVFGDTHINTIFCRKDAYKGVTA